MNPQLTSLEMEILAHIADGRKAGEIGVMVGSSKNAVDQRIHIMKNKMGAATAAGLVARAFRLGVLA